MGFGLEEVEGDAQQLESTTKYHNNEREKQKAEAKAAKAKAKLQAEIAKEEKEKAKLAANQAELDKAKASVSTAQEKAASKLFEREAKALLPALIAAVVGIASIAILGRK